MSERVNFYDLFMKNPGGTPLDSDGLVYNGAEKGWTSEKRIVNTLPDLFTFTHYYEGMQVGVRLDVANPVATGKVYRLKPFNLCTVFDHTETESPATKENWGRVIDHWTPVDPVVVPYRRRDLYAYNPEYPTIVTSIVRDESFTPARERLVLWALKSTVADHGPITRSVPGYNTANDWYDLGDTITGVPIITAGISDKDLLYYNESTKTWLVEKRIANNLNEMYNVARKYEGKLMYVKYDAFIMDVTGRHYRLLPMELCTTKAMDGVTDVPATYNFTTGKGTWGTQLDHWGSLGGDGSVSTSGRMHTDQFTEEYS